MPRYSRSVLLIDDDPTDRALSRRELLRMGFDVIDTASPEEAMSVIVSGRIGCLVTDQAMPITGQELVDIVNSVRGDVGVVFLSGATEPRAPIGPGAVFVTKGNREALRAAVLNCMERWSVPS